MALQGTLRDFGITEIIQLIGHQLKTGILKIRRGKKIVEIYFVEGMIVHVYSNYRGKKDLIGEILVKAQLISEEQLERVLRIQKETLKCLGEILVELQYLTKDDVLKVISTQTYETIYDLFWWDDGFFNFDLEMVDSYKKIPFALSPEQVLLNILRMVEGWSEIEKKLYSPHIVLKRTIAPEGKAMGGSISLIDLKERLATEQELIYNLIDGNLTVQEIIDQSLLGKFIASETLVNLLDMGWVELVGVRTPNLIQKVGLIKFREALPFVYYGVFFVFCFLALVYVKPNVLIQFLDSKIERVHLEIPTHFIQKTQLDRIKVALEIYYLEKGNYPSNLEELISAELLQKSDVFYRHGINYQYGLKDGKYFIKH